MRQETPAKKDLPLPVVLGAIVLLLILVGWFGYSVLNRSQEGVTSPADAHRMMMDYMKRGGKPGEAGTGAAPSPGPTGKTSH